MIFEVCNLSDKIGTSLLPIYTCPDNVNHCCPNQKVIRQPTNCRSLDSTEWLMSADVSELGSQGPAPCTQSTRSVHAAVPKDYERDFTTFLSANHLTTILFI